MEDLFMKNKIISILVSSIILILCFVRCNANFGDIKIDINTGKESDMLINSENKDKGESNTDSSIVDSYITYTFSNLEEFYLYAETDEDDISKFPHLSEDYFPDKTVFKYIDKDKFIRLENIFPEFLDGKLKLEAICVNYYDDYIYCFENDVLIFISPLRNWPENKATSYSYIENGNKSNEVFFRLNEDIRITVRVNKSKENEIRKLSIDSLNELLSGEYTILAERIAEFSESKGNKN